MATVYAIGETVFDIIFAEDKPVNAVPGGSMLNAAISLGRWGSEVEFISEYGTDHVGGIIDTFLSENQVASRYCYKYETGATSIALAFLDQDKKASYSFYHNQPEKLPEPRIPEFRANDICLFGSYYAIKPERALLVNTLIHEARKSGATIIYDPNIRKAHAAELPGLFGTIENNLSSATIIKGSDEDFYQLFSTLEPEAIYDHTQKYCKNLVITRGSKDVLLFTPNFQKKYPVPEIEPLSTIGAGDNFNAGLACGLLLNPKPGEKISDLSPHEWDRIIGTAIQFAVATCLSMENYVPRNFSLLNEETI